MGNVKDSCGWLQIWRRTLQIKSCNRKFSEIRGCFITLQSNISRFIFHMAPTTLHPSDSSLNLTNSGDGWSHSCQWASCATYGRDPCTLHHERLSTDEARSWTMQQHWDDLKRVAQQELTLSIFHAARSLIRLVFVKYITFRLLLDHDQPRFVVWQVMSPSALLMQLLITTSDHLSKA